MKTILISILLCIIVTVGGTIMVSKKHWREKAKTEVKDDFLNIPEYKTETSTVPSYTPTSTYSGDNSYWFVVGLDNTGVMRNGFFEQNHPYFSYSEAKASFKKDCFITNIVKIDKETYEHNK
jgi:hypothetical protein